jgi:hypothetical protein
LSELLNLPLQTPHTRLFFLRFCRGFTHKLLYDPSQRKR